MPLQIISFKINDLEIINALFPFALLKRVLKSMLTIKEIFSIVPSFTLISTLVIVLLSVISFLIPKIGYYFMISISLLLLSVNISISFFGLPSKQQNCLKYLLIFLNKISLLDFFATVYVIFFCVPKSLLYKKLSFIFIVSVVYVYTASIYYYYTHYLNYQFSSGQYIMVYIILFLGLAML